MEMKPGIRVVRGPDWKWGDQDGGNGHVGTVAEVKTVETPSSENRLVVVTVQWDGGNRCKYRCGIGGKYDLLIYDSGPVSIVHTGYICDSCEEEEGIVGMRWRCLICFNYDLCTNCYMNLKHDVDHQFVRHDSPELPKVYVAARGTAKRIQAKGLFADAIVSQGHDWIWGNQDGCTDNTGTLVSVKGWEKDSYRSVAEVKWENSSKKNEYRIGHKGKVDLKVITPGDGWMYIPSHLPVLGKPLDDLFEATQEGQRVWFDHIHDVQGQASDAVKIFPKSDPSGEDAEPKDNTDNPDVLVAAAAVEDIATLRDFLSKHLEEVNTKVGGKAAIHYASITGNIPVLECLLKSGADIEIEDENGNRPLHMCAFHGKDEVAKLLLDSGANVNRKDRLRGATPLDISAAMGHISVMKVLFQHPDIDLYLQDNTGDNALHYAVNGKQEIAIFTLLEAGINPELLNFRLISPIHFGFLPAMELFLNFNPQYANLPHDTGTTPLHLAILNNHLDFLTILLESEECDIDFAQHDMPAALHIALLQGKGHIVETLVGFGANLNLQDKYGNTPLHITLTRKASNAISINSPQLLKVQAKLNIEGDDTEKCSTVMACFLALEGAEPYIQNNGGVTPLFDCSADIAALIAECVSERKENTSSSTFHSSLCHRESRPSLSATADNILPMVSTHRKLEEVSPLPTQSEEIPPEKLQLSKPTANSDVMLHSSTTAYKECMLCEGLVNIVLKPCNHSVICRECSKHAKKCPECHQRVSLVEDLIPKCIMCEEDDATVTFLPCKHMYCPVCAARQKKKCMECKSPIQSKLGLPDPTLKSSTPSPSLSPKQGSLSVCEMCNEEPKNTVLTCGHRFCEECSHNVDTCPTCKKTIHHRVKLIQ